MILGLLQTYNGEKYIDKCLRSLHAVCDKILVLDDGSTDNTSGILCEKEWSKIAFVATLPPQPRDWMNGDSFNRNLMLRMADRYEPEHCVSLDDDEEFEDPEEVRGFILKNNPWATAFHLVHFWDTIDVVKVRNLGSSRLNMRVRHWRWKLMEKVEPKDLHCGSSPSRAPALVKRMECLRILHYGYMDEADRRQKLNMYERLDPFHKLNGGRNYADIVSPLGLVPFKRKNAT